MIDVIIVIVIRKQNQFYFRWSPTTKSNLMNFNSMLDMACTTWGSWTNCLNNFKVYSSRDSMRQELFMGYGMDSKPTSSLSLLSWNTVIVLVGNWNNPEVECSESLGTEPPYLLQRWVGPDGRGEWRYQTAPASQGGVKGWNRNWCHEQSWSPWKTWDMYWFYESQGPSWRCLVNIVCGKLAPGT